VKTVFCNAVGLLLVAGQVAQAVATPSQTEAAIFAALTVSEGQSARAIISNLATSDGGTNSATCKLQVRFFGPDGSLVANAETLELKRGESRSVAASKPLHLLRVSISIERDIEASKPCDIKARLEVFDLHTGTTYVSEAPDSTRSASGCSASPQQTSISAGQDVTSSIGRHRAKKRKTSPLAPLPPAPSTAPTPDAQ
jgi:ligand-binding sensor domain-containing protein